MTALPAIQPLRPEDVVAACDVGIVTARKVVASIHQRFVDDVGAQVPRNARRVEVDAIAARYRVGALRVVTREASAVDPFVKYVLECEDGARIETVRIPLEKPGRFVVCVSSQVGCAIGCAFCATGRLGLSRNLEAWEIVEQVRVVRRELPPGTRVHGVVFQGMGEPLANVDRVMQAIGVLHDPCGHAIEQRNITVCTVGVPSGIRRLAASGLRVRLGVSIASARPEVRRSLVPVQRSNPLDEVLEAAAEFVEVTGDAPMFAITPLAGVNTADADADALAEIVRAFKARTGVAPRLSLVPYNPIGDDDPFGRASDEEYDRFHKRLAAIGVPVVRRYSGGGDVGAACGQLVARATRGA
ncbi:MAG: radical SAM protein [Deltaproteobacteria bacterium]|nr:radical SAM protein [Deltaproteobacteria bacterium]